MSFRWKDSYNTNIKEIDSQHMKLFEIGSRLQDIASTNDGYDRYDEIIALLDELREYTIYHFSFEEKLMQDNKFEGYDIHKIEHDFFVKKLVKLEKSDLEDGQGESVMKMVSFVADWISAHILKTDFQYREFFNGKGIY